MILTIIIIIVFVAGYMFIATEAFTGIHKAAIALFMCVALWTLYSIGLGDGGLLTSKLLEHLGDNAQTIFFLMGAMTIVEIVELNGGFNFVREKLHTTRKRSLLWRIVAITFILSAILDNMTTSIVMIMVLRKLVGDHKERLLYAGLIIIAANSGGAFSPIGDVTTIMLWIKGNITTLGVIHEILLPSIISAAVPAAVLSAVMKGTVTPAGEQTLSGGRAALLTALQRKVVFFEGVGGLIFVPIFRELSGLPPFMGILLVLSILWITTEIMIRERSYVAEAQKYHVDNIVKKIDMGTLLFFLGILMAVAVLSEQPIDGGSGQGILAALGQWLDETLGNAYLITGAIGMLSAIIDNVPLVASCMGMYNIADITAAAADPNLQQFVVDGVFWQLLAYCAGVGGSMLIIGSAAGVVVMGLEKITFGWYMKHFSWLAFIGYLSGMVVYWIEKSLGW